jgi:hypothetical protein
MESRFETINGSASYGGETWDTGTSWRMETAKVIEPEERFPAFASLNAKFSEVSGAGPYRLSAVRFSAAHLTIAVLVDKLDSIKLVLSEALRCFRPANARMAAEKPNWQPSERLQEEAQSVAALQGITVFS